MKKEIYKQLIDVVKLLNSSLDFEKIKKIIIQQTKKIFNAEASSLLFLDKEKNELYFDVATGEKGDIVKEIRVPADKGIAGWIIKNNKPLLVKNVKEDKRFYSGVDKKSNFTTKSIMGAPVYNGNDVFGVIEVLNKKTAGTFSEDELKLLEVFSDLASLNIRNALWHKNALEKERYESELRVAEKIQKKLIGKHSIDIKGYEYMYNYRSCKAVGGDYYDILQNGENEYFFAIADVSGKGVPTSIIMSALRSYLKTANHFNLNLVDAINFINKNIYEDTESSIFITMILGILNTEKNTFKYVNAGHVYPILIDKKNNYNKIASNDIPVGIIKNYKYEIKSIDINPEDTLVMVTDGITEATNERSEMYEENKLKNDLIRFINYNYKELDKLLFDRVLKYCNYNPHDDMTLLGFRKK
ncbi:MAG: SpoIIE family protein phosphatase [Candidatus Mcinerneyibacterium aminivorans]|uniref:SpoIIE family protein phosphatase n=1 Tax=Candidatus Mcinerneyibacterium aminivorans TaxID=2703815 RepID=A0A5D0MHC7_9BACT|nr:MAG: SpoIIE family protein phosphatase [Candidatus Mcinerneyibacterium aminivorans]